ncbi:hypothetical protein bhn_I1887 [Butyrivibrio hungatei]|uniref:Uncharacterized protein n=1 Tax=Butyrivibrio hungatei TaxID=185008 RepID=A0A1D9P2X7_9FIRM|nr:hypothetical protein bhn_I1887 [Butyrivibrio hungatei]
MYAIVNDVLYRYSDFLDDVRIFTKNNEKAHNGFSHCGNYYEKKISEADDCVTDIYNIKFWIDYKDNYFADQNEWYVAEDNRCDRKYRLEDEELCLNVFGSISEKGWHSLGRNEENHCFSIMNPTIYLPDGSTTVVKGTFTIRKMR